MNEMYFYDPEIYHPLLTHSVFVTLEGCVLKLSYPKTNLPRRATFDEELLDVAFVSHRSYDMSNAKVRSGHGGSGSITGSSWHRLSGGRVILHSVFPFSKEEFP